MKLEARVVLSRSEEERIAKLGFEFREFLQRWLGMVMMGVKFTPGVAQELGRVFCEYAAIALIAPSDAAANEADEKTSERAKRAAKEAFDLISREVLS